MYYKGAFSVAIRRVITNGLLVKCPGCARVIYTWLYMGMGRDHCPDNNTRVRRIVFLIGPSNRGLGWSLLDDIDRR